MEQQIATRVTKPYKIVVADDNKHFHRIFECAWHERNPIDEINFVSSGKELIEHLKKCEKDSKLRPDMILLDLNMPDMNGKEALLALKSDLDFDQIPVVMLTASGASEDIEFCYHLGCCSYMTKPSDYHELVDTLDQLRRFSFEISKIPGRPN